MALKDDLLAELKKNPAELAYAQDTPVPDIATVLAGGMWYDIFYKSVKIEFSLENLNFLRAAASYKSSPSIDAGQKLYDEYIWASGPQVVNIPQSMRNPLDAIFGSDAPADVVCDGATFDEAVGEITRLLDKDSFYRFKSAIDGIQAAQWDVETREHS